ncbi:MULTISPECIES: response regulator [Stenotrophomonas]|uniref:response regulator n=1 Tax=Stenotrophomonas TaxID=40323 RepID=UPI0008733199|nr:MULTISPECIES: response regulator [Stenotrophomonas]OEZ01702.1 hypothetical protein BIY45_05020 [Stenotrophomonas sp. BIIR7]
METRIVIADDHPVVLIGARAIIESARVGVIVGEAGSTDALIDLLDNVECDVLVTDFSMPGTRYADGLRMLDVIHHRHPQLPIVLLTMLDNAGVLKTAMSKGVSGLIDKSSTMAGLANAVNVVKQGGVYVAERWREPLEADRRGRVSGSRQVRLSPREYEVVRLLASGFSVSEIAARLDRTISTISRQKGTAMRKLGIDSDAGLFEYAQHHGLLSR